MLTYPVELPGDSGGSGWKKTVFNASKTVMPSEKTLEIENSWKLSTKIGGKIQTCMSAETCSGSRCWGTAGRSASGAASPGWHNGFEGSKNHIFLWNASNVLWSERLLLARRSKLLFFLSFIKGNCIFFLPPSNKRALTRYRIWLGNLCSHFTYAKYLKSIWGFHSDIR